MSIHLFGIRHHGPGCARSLQAALEKLEPDIVLVEGPPDAQDALPLLTGEGMKPPVALLIYRPEEPQRAVFYPFAHFSPEWQALRYALIHKLPARFIDLPQAIQLADPPEINDRRGDLDGRPPNEPNNDKAPDEDDSRGDPRGRPGDNNSPGNGNGRPEDDNNPNAATMRRDPLRLLAEAAGYSDAELWWERQVEQRSNAADLFDATLEAMSAMRDGEPPEDEREARREAHMRQCIRAAQAEGFQRIAVVCGAWHAPVLVDPDQEGREKDDAKLLKGLKRVKVEATWIPWTYSRLTYTSGYGAGISSPGWYEQLWHTPERVALHWITRAAHLLREEGLDASSASIIEAVRLGETLAALRDLPLPGRADLNEAILTVLCSGADRPMDLIRERLEVAERLGTVPAETPVVPLQRDLETQQRRLRLKPSTEITTLDLDLRNETNRARSRLLHRLALLNIPWGRPQQVWGKSGTFHEVWQLQWKVEFAVSIIEANVWGNTVENACTAYVRRSADTLQDLPLLTALLDKTILAELPASVDYLLQQVQQRAALSADVRHMMDALPPLARVARYSDVRQTSSERVLPVIDNLFERVLIGLPAACASLDDDAAQEVVGSINNVQESISLLDRQDMRDAWQHLLLALMERESIHGLVRGRCCRLLLEQSVLSGEALQREANLALSPVNPPRQTAAWIEGVLRGSGMLILHQDGLWHALDSWLCDLHLETFEEQLPLLRRAFSDFQPPERRAMSEKVKHLHTPAGKRADGLSGDEGTNINQERADMVLPVLAQILGVRV